MKTTIPEAKAVMNAYDCGIEAWRKGTSYKPVADAIDLLREASAQEAVAKLRKVWPEEVYLESCQNCGGTMLRGTCRQCGQSKKVSQPPVVSRMTVEDAKELYLIGDAGPEGSWQAMADALNSRITQAVAEAVTARDIRWETDWKEAEKRHVRELQEAVAAERERVNDTWLSRPIHDELMAKERERHASELRQCQEALVARLDQAIMDRDARPITVESGEKLMAEKAAELVDGHEFYVSRRKLLSDSIRKLAEPLFDVGPWVDRAGRLHEASGQRDSFSFREFL